MPATINGDAFLDANSNGVQDTGEDVVAGVGVSISLSSGSPITVYTDGSGYYEAAGLAPDWYTIQVAPPPGYDVTTPDGGTATVELATDADVVGVGIGLSNSSGSGSGNNPPVLDDIPEQDITPGQPFLLQVAATDPDGDPITYSASGLPAGLGIDPNTGLVSGTLPDDGTYQPGTTIPVSFTADDGRGGTDSTATDLLVEAPLPPPPPPPPPPAGPAYVVGAAPGGEPWVWVYDSAGNQLTSFLAYEETFTGGVRTAMADLNGDGTPDIVTAPGPGGGPRVRAFDGLTGTILADFYAYDQSFLGGVFVAAGPVGDGQIGIATGADAGGGPHVETFAADGTLTQSFFAFDETFTGGVRVAVGQTAAGAMVYAANGPGMAPTVRGFDAGTGAQVFEDAAGDEAETGGVYVGTGDLAGDGQDEVVTAAPSGSDTLLQVFGGADGTWVGEAVVSGAADGIGVLSWGGQPAVGVMGDTALTVYSLGDFGEAPVVLASVDASGWGGSGAGLGGAGFSLYPRTITTGGDTWYSAMFEGSPDQVQVREVVTQVSADEYRWAYTFTNTSVDVGLENSFFNQGAARFDLGFDSQAALDAITRFDTPAGWTATPGADGLRQVRWETGGDFIMPGESRTFAFYTPPLPVSGTEGTGFNASYMSSVEGAGLVPGPAIKSVTWVQKPGETGGVLGEQPAGTPGGGKRIFSEAAAPGGNFADEVNIRVELTDPQAGVEVHMWLFDVDDPSSHEAPLDDESKEKDNRGDGFSDEGPGYVGSAETDANGVVVFTRRVSSQPGDNYRAVASIKGTSFTDTFVGVKQDDGTNAGVYLLDDAGKLTAKPVPQTKAEIVSSPLLTVWRHLTIERDHMAAPPAGEVFNADEPSKDVDPGGPIPDLDISEVQTYFKAAYIDVRDAGALNTNKTIPWTHIWDTEDNFNTAMAALGESPRDVQNSRAYWAVRVIAAYEPYEASDYDPPENGPLDTDKNPDGIEDGTSGQTIGGDAVSVVFTEVVRDTVADGHPGYWQWSGDLFTWDEVPAPYTINHDLAEGLRRTTYHEVVHNFGLEHADPYDANNPGDQGILDNEVMAVGDADYIKLNPAQLDSVRKTEKPG